MLLFSSVLGKEKITVLLLIFTYNAINNITFVRCGMSEDDRIKLYKNSGYTWPPSTTEYMPPSESYSEFMNKRFQQLSCTFQTQSHVHQPEVSRIDKYLTYKQLIRSTMFTPNLTEYGFAITKAPTALVDELKDLLHSNLNSSSTTSSRRRRASSRPEGKLQVIHYDDDNPNIIIPMNGLNNKILRELRYMHEQWISDDDDDEGSESSNENSDGKRYIKLVPNNAYGLRVYMNNSNLLMHLDNAQTHIVSSILHVDHDPDGEPWPLVIEGHDGNTYEVFLESGDMLFYESSKCLHGRPKPYVGKYYSSLFIHYYPEFCTSDNFRNQQKQTGTEEGRQYWCGYDEKSRVDEQADLRLPPYWDNVLFHYDKKIDSKGNIVQPPNSLCGMPSAEFKLLVVNSTNGLNLQEPTCGESKWCPIYLNKTRSIHGPATYGIIRTANNKTKPIHVMTQSEKEQRRLLLQAERRGKQEQQKRASRNGDQYGNQHDEL